MGTYEDLKQAISAVIKENNNQEITGEIMQSALLSIINNIGANATFAGIATPATTPGSPDANIFYLAIEPGNYVNFGGVEVGELSLLYISNNAWVSKELIKSKKTLYWTVSEAFNKNNTPIVDVDIEEYNTLVVNAAEGLPTPDIRIVGEGNFTLIVENFLYSGPTIIYNDISSNVVDTRTAIYNFYVRGQYIFATREGRVL